MKKVKTVIFDFGNVLAFVNHMKICKKFEKHSPFNKEKIHELVFQSAILEKYEKGHFNSARFYEIVKKTIKAPDKWRYEQFFTEFKDAFLFNNEGADAVERYAGKKRIFVLSNTGFIHALWLLEQEIYSTIPEIYVFSFKIGVMKPDRAIWDYALKLGCVEPSECVYIDDIETFCEAADKIGIKSIHYRSGKVDLIKELDLLID